MPCIGAFAASKRELQSLKEAMMIAAFQTGMAYVFAFAVYHICLLFV